MSTLRQVISHPFEQSRYIGKAIEVNASSGNILLDARGEDKAANVGDYAVIKVGQIGIFGRISNIQMSSKTVTGDGRVPLVAEIQFLNSIDISTGKVTPGISAHPNVDSEAYLAHPSLVQHIVSNSDKYRNADEGLIISYASLPEHEESNLSFTPEMLFGRHCAILGSTGGGKSWSVAKLVEESSRFQSKVILLDATGEYFRLSPHVRHIYLGKDPKAPEDAVEVSLPYNHLTESDLFAIFKPQGQSQAPKLREAIRSLKLALLEPSLAMDGTIVKAHKNKAKYLACYAKHMSEIERPYSKFDISHLPRQIENECVKPNRSAMEPNIWGDINGVDRSLCIPLITRVSDIIQSANLAPLFNPGTLPSLIDELNDFLRSDIHHVLRISLQYLSFEHNAREIVANTIGRYLLDLARKEVFRRKPMLMVVDEAHQFLNVKVESMGGVFPLDSFALIAKEGRKYSLNICICTQRPRDIPEGVLSQMGTLIVHRLINDRDRYVVERASGHFDKASLDILPALAPGEAVILGVDFPIPLTVKVIPPLNKPDSRGPDYQRYWS